MATLEELLAEKQRRADAKAAPTQKGHQPAGQQPAPQYTVGDVADTLRVVPQEQQAEMPAETYPGIHTDRSTLRGLTMGLSDPIGAGIATAMALPHTLRQQAERQRGEGREPDLLEAITTGVPETYRDIRGTLQHEQDRAEAADPERMEQAEGFGTLASVGALTAGPLRQATSAAMRRGAARLGGSTGGSTAATTAARKASRKAAERAVKPKIKMTSEGPVALNEAGARVLKKAMKASRKEMGKAGAQAGATADAIQAATLGDLDPDATLAGTAAGVFFPNAARGLLNTPIGRLMLSRTMSKVVGQKYQPYIYTGVHPASRRFFGKITGGGK